MTSLTLNDGVSIPLLAYGTGTAILKSKTTIGGDVDSQVVNTIKLAIRAGYRHLDTAEMYLTEPELGVAIKESIAEGIVKRDDLFVTTKISSEFAQASKKISVSLQKLGLDYVDLYLIHTPYLKGSDGDLQGAWAAMEAVKASGKVRSIGVSNYEESHLAETLAAAKVPPSINQIEFHPYLQHGGLLAFSRANGGGVATSAYGALSPVTRNIAGPLDETLARLAAKYDVSAGMICLRWCIDQDIVPERMAEYLRVFDFKLSPKEVQEIATAGVQSLKGEELIPRVVQYHRMIEKSK
ncbi:NADPH-dependent conjugated polyketone reductase C1 [Diplogelasinospora grovesii]|uniref:NADPH-dependent conjugated polyketone reductase C1 n=1 Tax=Diplogelasinospora grovesii TaxID=303347 RepID=A0AAN6NH96_9PEZI|nr:NADPH-dependent conjugated polyketone reductase C1 [Diplogelasinospora grovesii]